MKTALLCGGFFMLGVFIGSITMIFFSVKSNLEEKLKEAIIQDEELFKKVLQEYTKQKGERE